MIKRLWKKFTKWIMKWVIFVYKSPPVVMIRLGNIFIIEFLLTRSISGLVWLGKTCKKKLKELVEYFKEKWRQG